MFYLLRGGRGRGLNLSGQNPLRQTKIFFRRSPIPPILNIYGTIIFCQLWLAESILHVSHALDLYINFSQDQTSRGQQLTPHTKKLLVNALVMPYFHYCSPAWSNAAPFRLSKINKKVVDASVFLGREDNYSIYNMLDKDISLLTFKALNNIAPNYLCSKIQMAKNCHSHNTRRAAKNHLQIPSSNTKFGMRTFAYRASKLWNDLPNELLDIKSLLKFKTSVKDFFN